MKSPRQDLSVGEHGGTSANLPALVVARGVSDRFQQIQSILAPVIGQGGVTALYERSRHLSSRTDPWLAVPERGLSSGMDLEDLKVLVAQQTDDAAAAGAGLLLKSFHDLLGGLVGPALTLQLIGASPIAISTAAPIAGPEADKTR